jgi:hypothetical protein
MSSSFDAIHAVLQNYFDGLYASDTTILRTVFHPEAIYACATGETLLRLNMEDYFAVVDQRVSPKSLGQARADRIMSIEFAGPVTALARVECTIAPKRFTDLLSLVRLDGRWQIISKVFHYDL